MSTSSQKGAKGAKIDPIHILSLGAGVQSSTLALMAARGEIGPMPTAAIFADTQAEPVSVYRWLDWLEKQLPFPVYRVTVGNLRDAELRIRRSKKSGRLYIRNSIPAFVLNPDGKKGLLGRKCTSDFKIVPIQRKVRELVGIKRGGKDVRSIMWVGISMDEAHRMKPSRKRYIQNRWPLIELRMSRNACMKWMTEHGFPEPPRSACTFCPFHSDFEWQRIKTEVPSEFESVVKFERDLQAAAKLRDTLKGTPYLHESCKPIGDIDFTLNEDSHRQLSLFGNECEGLCGL